MQELQQAKAQLLLPIALTKLDRFDLLIVDDLGYVKKSQAETSVLFELIAHRYERNSLLITANQPFSQWDDIFADAMMTVAAVDRLVHHASSSTFRPIASGSRLPGSDAGSPNRVSLSLIPPVWQGARVPCQTGVRHRLF